MHRLTALVTAGVARSRALSACGADVAIQIQEVWMQPLQPLRIRIDRIVDFTVIVSLVGIDAETTKPIAVYIDHRPFAVFRRALQETGLAPLSEYAANQLMLHLDFSPADGAESASLSESDSPAAST